MISQTLLRIVVVACAAFGAVAAPAAAFPVFAATAAAADWNPGDQIRTQNGRTGIIDIAGRVMWDDLPRSTAWNTAPPVELVLDEGGRIVPRPGQ
jgi:hypothetical protein